MSQTDSPQPNSNTVVNGIELSDDVVRDEGERKRLLILRALHDVGGKANTSKISAMTGIKSRNVRHHCGRLHERDEEDDDPLVKKTGQVRTSGNQIDPNEYALTPEGKEVAAEIDEDTISVGQAESITELRAIVSQQQRAIKSLRTEIQNYRGIWDEFDNLASAQDNLAERFKEIDSKK